MMAVEEATVSTCEELNKQESHNLKWCETVNVIFDDMTESLAACHPNYVNQVIPPTCLVPNGTSADIDIEINLHTLNVNVSFPGDVWEDPNNFDLKNQLNDLFSKFSHDHDLKTKTKETIQDCNYFKDKIKIINDDLYFCQVAAVDNGIAEFHSKLHLITLFYIDGASFIEYDDPRWTIFYLFKKNTAGDMLLVGFCTLYRFWVFPDKTRVRISQLIVLPLYQNLSYGTLFLDSILNFYRCLDDCFDITVEDPNENFSTIFDSIDIYRLQQLSEYDSSIKNAIDIQACLRNNAIKKLKISNKRFIILSEMMALYACDNNEDLEVWTENFKRRLKQPLKIQIERAQSVKCKYSEDIKMEIIEQLGREMMMIPEAVDIARESYSNTLLRSSKLAALLDHHVMSTEGEKQNKASSMHEKLSKCDFDNVYNNDEDDDDDDNEDTNYIPSLIEEQEADKETIYVHSLEENDNKTGKSRLDEKTVKEIDDLWEQMKAQQNNSKSSSLCVKETNTVSKTDSNENYINTTPQSVGISDNKITPQKRKRTSTMDDIIKRHSTSKRESTLTKSKKLWQIYRQEENIGDELDIQSKNSHIEKVSFLNQAKYNEWKRAKEHRLKDMFRKQN